MNNQSRKPIDPVLFSPDSGNRLRKQQPDRPVQLFPPEAEDSDTLASGLPPLPGIDLVNTLRKLNNKEDLVIQMLYDFKRFHSSLPATLRELSAAGNWPEIQRKAHALRGIASYIGSDRLQQAAVNLDDALHHDQRQAAVEHLDQLIDIAAQIIASLSALPSRESRAVPDRERSVAENSGSGAEAQTSLGVLIGQLDRGEFTAEEQFRAVEQLLVGAGFDRQLNAISRYIDDIEYQHAADMAQKLLTAIIKQQISPAHA